ncbi:MAG TPA: hypothetical protein VKQ52_17375 [Puia sp.]|nr:hypothetical protein [Puia sp.]
MDILPPDPLANSSIPLSTACERIANWQTAFGDPTTGCMVDPLLLPRAAFIPIADIKALADKYEHFYGKPVVGVRAYFGLMHPKFEGHIRLLLVPVLAVYEPEHPIQVHFRDLIVEHHRLSPDAGDETSIYDFTKPCPDFCDPTSILYNS